MTKVISVLNFKGGVGKTTLAFHLATHIATKCKEKSVLVVDLDHQASISLVMLGKEYNSYSESGLTSNLIFKSFCDHDAKMPGSEIIVNNPFFVRSKNVYSKKYDNVHLVPAQLELDDTEIDLASTTFGSPAKSDWAKRTLICSWLDKVKAHEKYEYIIFDCAPATKLVTQNAIAASKYYVVPVIPDELSTRGVTHLINLINSRIDKKLEFLREMAGIKDSSAPKSYIDKTCLVGIAPFMVKPASNAVSGYTNIHTEQLAALYKRWGKHALKSVIRHMTGYSECMSRGWPVFDESWNKNVYDRDLIDEMTSVCDEIESRLT